MKIIHVSRQFYPSVGGVENVVLNLARRQISLGHKVSVVTLNRVFSDGEKLSKHDEISGIKILRIPFCGSMRYPIAPSVIRHIENSDIVHIHCVDFFVDFLVLTKWWHKKKIVLHTHGGFFHTKWLYYFKKIYFHTITRTILKGCNRIIAVSQNDLDIFAKISKNVVLIENGVDVDTFTKVKKNITIGKFLYLGRIDRHKKIENLIQVIANIRRKSFDVHLEVYGPDWQGYLAELKKYSLNLGVAESIIWKGKVADRDIQNAFEKAQFYFSASEYEGFGVSAVEAMATGTVCVLNDIVSFRKILGAEAQLIVNFNDIDTAVKKILELMKMTQEQYLELSKRLKNRARIFSWDSIIKKIEDVYQGCF